MSSCLLKDYDNVFFIIFTLTLQLHIHTFLSTSILLQLYLSCFLSNMLGLKEMGLSESVLSCLPFIAGLPYLVDPLWVCVYMYTYTYTCMPTAESLMLLYMAFSQFIIGNAFLSDSRHANIWFKRRGKGLWWQKLRQK